MKNLKFILLVLFVSFLIGNGCRKDEAVFFQDYQTNLRSDSLYDYYKGFVLPDGSIISQRPTAGEFSCLQDIPDHTWNGLAVIDLIIRYENLKCNNFDTIISFGTPVWPLTIDSSGLEENITYVPLVNNFGNLSGIFSVYKSDTQESYMFVKYDNLQNDEKEFLEILVSKSLDDTNKCWDGKGGKDRTFWQRLRDFFTFTSGGNGPGGGIAGGYYTGNFSNFGGYSSGNTNYGGGGSSLISRYIRPFAGYEVCDPRLKTVEGCKKFFKDHLGAEVSTPDLEDKIKTCGCFGAVLFVDHQEWVSVNDPKQRCLLCDGNAFLNGGYGSTVDKLFNVLNYTEFPCTNVDPNLLANAKDELLGDICSKVAYDHNYYPGKLYNDYIALLKQMNVDFLTRSNNHTGLDAASDAIIKMGSLFGMNDIEVKNLTNEQICRKLEVTECLLPKFLDDSGYNTGDEEIERDKELFWDMVQSTYYDPCTGAQKDIDDALLALCQQNKLSGRALINKLNGVDYIINNISNNRINCLWKKLMNSNNNVICEQISYYEGKTKLNLKIFSQNLNGQNAVTWFDDRDGHPYISFDESLSTKCDVEIIKTMIHESVHAGILNIVRGTHAAGWGLNDIPDLKYYYNNFSNFHHEYMAGVYFNKLVSALKQYFGNEYTDLEYEAIMWNGLHNTTTYKAMSPEKRAQIEAIWDKFKNSTTCKKSCL